MKEGFPMNTFKLPLFTTLVAITFSTPQATYGMEGLNKEQIYPRTASQKEEPKKQLRLKRGADAVARKYIMQNSLFFRDITGARQDEAQARECLEKAAAQGNADAQNSLGVFYYEGLGVQQDYTQAKGMV
jgi:TPR repeat protein